jgi:hypothetical protein
VPILWVWPQRGITAKFYANSAGAGCCARRAPDNLDFMTAASASLPQQGSVSNGAGCGSIAMGDAFDLRSDDGSTSSLTAPRHDAGGVSSNAPNCHHFDDPRTAPDSPALVQTDGAYEFYAWTPPGEAGLKRSRRSNCSSGNNLRHRVLAATSLCHGRCAGSHSRW